MSGSALICKTRLCFIPILFVECVYALFVCDIFDVLRMLLQLSYLCLLYSILLIRFRMIQLE